jgi:hypothetical protein
MYKSRITQWGLDKKYKEDEMRAIVHKTNSALILGKSRYSPSEAGQSNTGN